jgi:hypothetical protein
MDSTNRCGGRSAVYKSKELKLIPTQTQWSARFKRKAVNMQRLKRYLI